jgi:hypothetical protein
MSSRKQHLSTVQFSSEYNEQDYLRWSTITVGRLFPSRDEYSMEDDEATYVHITIVFRVHL